jgi:hypothetical protein
MLSRRHFTIAFLFSASVTSISQADESTEFDVRIRASDQALNAAVSAPEQMSLSVTADQSDDAKLLLSKAPKTKAIPVILIIVGAVAAVNISKMLLELVREYYYGGVLIDNTASPTLITNDVRIPAGTIIVISKDGSKATFKESDVSWDFVYKILNKA